MRTYRKDSDDLIRRGIDWSDRLIEDDKIAGSEWTIGQGLTGDSATFNDVYSDIDLSGGTLDTQYKVTNKITTDQGYIYSRSFYIQVVNK